MSTAGGPKIETDGLVFGYDTGRNPSSDFNHKNKKRRHFRGEPTTNLWDSIDNTQSLRGNRTQHYWDGKRWVVDSSYTHPGVDGPKNVYLGKVFKFTSGALNSIWSGNSHGYMLRDIATTSGQTYTMSAWVYASIDCDVTSIPAVIEGEAGGESTVSGFPASYNLSNKGTWQRTAKKALADGNVRFIPTYTRKNGVTDGSFSGFFMWAAPQVVLGDRPKPYIETGNYRSPMHSLIDLTKSALLDISNVSFDSDGLPTFDGTDDRIVLKNHLGLNITTTITVEAVVKYDAQGGGGESYSVITYKGHPWNWLLEDQGGKFNFRISTSNVSDSNINSNFSHGLNTYHHVVATYNGSTQAIYVNGVLKASKSLTGSILTTGNTVRVGSYVNGDYVHNGKIPSVKVYNKALTAQEVKQNFKAYKNRFNI